MLTLLHTDLQSEDLAQNVQQIDILLAPFICIHKTAYYRSASSLTSVRIAYCETRVSQQIRNLDFGPVADTKAVHVLDWMTLEAYRFESARCIVQDIESTFAPLDYATISHKVLCHNPSSHSDMHV